MEDEIEIHEQRYEEVMAREVGECGEMEMGREVVRRWSREGYCPFIIAVDSKDDIAAPRVV